MSRCPICEQKSANCECTPYEREQHEKIEELESDLAAAHRRGAIEARPDIIRECCRDVCMYCGGRAVGYAQARGPNSAGNYTHTHLVGGNEVLCTASALWSRLRYEAEGEK